MVARCVRDAKVVGSNPVASTKNPYCLRGSMDFLIIRHATGFEGGSHERERVLCLLMKVLRIDWTAKATIDNCRAGRAAKGANPVASYFPILYFMGNRSIFDFL